ncbi:MAG: DMT family transporter [Spirochaetota bacterium]
MDNKTAGFIHLHIAVLLFGLAGLFGKWIAQQPVVIVLGRAFFAAISLALLLIFTRKTLIPSGFVAHLHLLILLGILLAVHWFSFFRAIQVSSIAVGVFTYSAFPVFVSFLEPLFFKERFKAMSVIAALVTSGGVALMSFNNGSQSSVSSGALWGVFSGLTFALLSLINRKLVKCYEPLLMALYQNATAAILLSPFYIVLGPKITGRDLLLLIILGIIFTAISHSLFISSLKYLKTRVASIIACLEPVYGVMFALLLLKEIPGLRVIAGGFIIIIMAIYISIRMERGFE